MLVYVFLLNFNFRNMARSYFMTLIFRTASQLVHRLKQQEWMESNYWNTQPVRLLDISPRKHNFVEDQKQREVPPSLLSAFIIYIDQLYR